MNRPTSEVDVIGGVRNSSQDLASNVRSNKQGELEINKL